MINWKQEQRQAPIGLILFFLQIVKVVLKSIWPLLIVFIFKDSSESKTEVYLYLILAFSTFLLIASIFSYLFFKFKIVDNELLIKRGFLRKLKTDIPFERIQTINIKQNILQLWLGLVSLEVDTAGSKGKEIKFIALKKELAIEMEKILSQGKQENEITHDASDIRNKKKTVNILNLSSSDLIKVSITENHLRSFLIILAFVYSIYNQARDVFQEQIDKLAEQSFTYAQNLALNSIITIGFITFIMSILVSFARTFIFFYKLKMSKLEHSIKIQHGLFNTKTWNIPISKIQIISFHHNPLRRLLKFSTLNIKQAVSENGTKKKSTIWVPSCHYKASETFKNLILETNNFDFSEVIRPHFRYFVIRFIWASIFLLSITLITYKHWQAWAILALAETFLLGFFLLKRKRLYARISDKNLYLSKGAISQLERYITLHKIQSVSYKQSIFQRRRKLCSLILHTASGTNLSIPYLPEYKGKELKNYLLYKIEISHKSWM